MSAPNLDYKTKCRVPGCTKEFISSPFNVQIIGKPDERIVKFVNALQRHMADAHGNLMVHILGSTQQLQALMIANHFDIQDPRLLEIQNQLRWTLHTFTQKFTFTDEQILQALAKMDLEPEQQTEVAAFMRDSRDFLLEQGRYAPQPTESKPLVTA